MAIVVQKHKFSTIFLLLIIIISSNFIPSHQLDRGTKIPKKTDIHFYFHDTISGRNPTAVNIIPAKSKYIPTSFGAVVMIDDPLTVGPDMSSGIMGRAQGFYGGAGMKTFVFLMVMNIVFTEGSKFNGSTLSVMGRNPVFETVREMSIVGGTGVFRFATGIARAKTYTFNKGDAVVEYNVTVHHFG